MRWSLYEKLLLMMLSLSSFLIIAIVLLNFYNEKALMNKMQKKIIEITEAIHLAVSEITKNEESDYMKLYNQLRKFQPEGVKEINIIDGSTKLKASTNLLKIGKTTTDTITELIFKSEMGQFVTKKGKIYHIVLPVVAKGEHQGYIHMIVSTEDIYKLFKWYTIKRLLVTVIVFFVGVIIALWLSSNYTKPIKEIVSSAEAVASGDLDISLSVKEKDEIGLLKESFNQMIQRLAEFRRLEERLRETEHLSTIRELSQTLAHELRNPLNFINLSVDHLIDINKETNFVAILESIKDEVKRLDILVNNFLTYGRPLRVLLKDINIVELIEQTLFLVYAKAEKLGVKIEKEYPDKNIILKADPELLKTCFFNIFQNAFQAMPNGGTLKIKIVKENHNIKISISDTGNGVEPEIAKKVFDPFFTTKEYGIGLGLAMTKRVIAEHKGRVEFKSIKGKGTTLTFILPIKC